MIDNCSIAKRVIIAESKALSTLAENIPDDFERIVNYLLKLRGRIILSGIGKSGYIARKISSSFSSTGMPSFYLHPAEANHGDLGTITSNDLVIILSNSGETRELMNIADYCQNFCIKIAIITMYSNSTLASKSDFILTIPQSEEASKIGAPTISALMMLSLGDALITTMHERCSFTIDNFRTYHPGGAIGANLTKIVNFMRKGDQIPFVYENTSFFDTIIVMNQKYLGCTLVTDKNFHLLGIVTDGDLRRHVNDWKTIKYAKDIMQENPIYIKPSTLAKDALYLMKSKNITVLPIVSDNIINGIIHIHDLLKSGVT